MFERLLIANRGEIACRVMTTARRLGVTTVAVFSDADRGARHVALADEAYGIGPAEAKDSYLRIDRILEVAEKSGCQAIHPGYGFLSENADFAAAVEAAGLIFVGPSAETIRKMGSKAEAKAIMAAAGVPVLEGYHGAEQGEEALATAASAVGFPLLIKAAAGGGGKGMRVVEQPEAFAAALAAAQREAEAGFGDSRVILERYLPAARHVEVQVFADRAGQTVHLFERDCSAQRRHQKVLEEAPAPGLSPELRQALGETAVQAARAVDYLGAGTVEFLLDGERFTFMEMNTRLQVEHPVTEMITGLDLVEWQLRVAADEPLPLAQEAVTAKGHAVEVRLYAEDPAKGFLPSTGRFSHLAFPQAEAGRLRVESGYRPGDTMTLYYDPMIAKLVTWGEDRAKAFRRMAQALAESEILGPASNLDFLGRLLTLPAVREGRLHSSALAEAGPALTATVERPDTEILALAVAAELLRGQEAARVQARRSQDPFSPWARLAERRWSWRLAGVAQDRLTLGNGETSIPIEVTQGGEPDDKAMVMVTPQGRHVLQDLSRQNDRVSLTLDDHRVVGRVYLDAAGLSLTLAGQRVRLEKHNPLDVTHGGGGASGRILAPMPGRVISVAVAAGERVRAGQALVVLEAMKMEHALTAPADGLVATLHAGEGELVDEGGLLLELSGED